MDRLLTADFLMSILAEMPVGVAIMNQDQQMIYYNRAGELASKMKIPDSPPEEWIGKYGIFQENGKDPYKPEEMPIVLSLNDHVINDQIMILKNVDVADVVLSVSSRPIKDKSGQTIASVAIFQNKTLEIKLKSQLDLASRLESIGRLAGGVAHDFNNMLGTVLMSANQCLKVLPLDHPCREELDMIVAVGEKSAALTRQLLAFGRKQIMQPKMVNISQVVQDSQQMISRLIGSNIEMKYIQSPRTPMAFVDPVQLEQIILNLATNARDSMPKGGLLTIETDVMEFDGKYIHTHAHVKAGKYALLSVTDTGIGIPKEDLSRIFDPFFSKKQNGFGLGLSTVQGIVEQSGGTIWVYSEEGKGTVFKIYLPFFLGKTTEQKEPVTQDLSMDGTETILLVEDDDSLKKTVAKCLVSRGYKVLLASNGIEAVRVVDSCNMPINLLLTDVVMPGMNGRELATRLEEKIPGLKVIFSSGYSENVIVNHGILKEGVQFLQKPVSENELLRKIRLVFSAPG